MLKPSRWVCYFCSSSRGVFAVSPQQSVLCWPPCPLVRVLYEETLINVLGLLCLHESHKRTKMQEKVTVKFMVFSFINCWMSIASSHSCEVLGFQRGVELRHGRVRRCFCEEGRGASSPSLCPQEQLGAGAGPRCLGHPAGTGVG